MGIINCPNCNKRIFEETTECPYCKYTLQIKENSFDKAKYDFLYYTYTQNQDKQATIKIGMEKFNMDMKAVKEIVDYISDEIYYMEEAKKNAIPKEELPTNGIDYSKIKYGKSFLFGTTVRKISPIKIIAIIVYFIIILFLYANTENESIQKGLFVAFLGGVFILVGIIINHRNIPDDPHTFMFSFLEYFKHRLIYQIVLILFLIYLPTHLEEKIVITQSINKVTIVIIYGAIMLTLLYFLIYQLLKRMTHHFTVQYGAIRYTHETLDFQVSYQNIHNPERYRKYIYYNIYSIKEVKETLNSIIIYGNMERNIMRLAPADSRTSKPKELDRLKVPKSFKNNKELIKSLKLCTRKR